MLVTFIEAVWNFLIVAHSGILVIVSYCLIELFSERRQKKDRIAEAKKYKLAKLEELMDEVGGLRMHLEQF